MNPGSFSRESARRLDRQAWGAAREPETAARSSSTPCRRTEDLAMEPRLGPAFGHELDASTHPSPVADLHGAWKLRSASGRPRRDREAAVPSTAEIRLPLYKPWGDGCRSASSRRSARRDGSGFRRRDAREADIKRLVP